MATVDDDGLEFVMSDEQILVGQRRVDLNGDGVRAVDPETLSRLRLLQIELVEATNTAQLLQQVRDLKQERFQLFLELVAARHGIDLQREEIRLSDGRILSR